MSEGTSEGSSGEEALPVEDDGGMYGVFGEGKPRSIVATPTSRRAAGRAGARPIHRTRPRRPEAPRQARSKRVTSSGSAVKGLAHSEVAPVMGCASVTTTYGAPG